MFSGWWLLQQMRIVSWSVEYYIWVLHNCWMSLQFDQCPRIQSENGSIRWRQIKVILLLAMLEIMLPNVKERIRVKRHKMREPSGTQMHTILPF